MAAIESQGTQLKRGDGGDPTEVFTAIGRVVSISGVGNGSSTEIDITDLSSTGKEYLLGLKDEGEVTVTLNLDTGDTMQSGLRTDRDNRTLRNFELALTDSGNTVISFAAYIKTFGIDVGVDDKVPLNVSLRISGAVTWA